MRGPTPSPISSLLDSVMTPGPGAELEQRVREMERKSTLNIIQPESPSLRSVVNAPVAASNLYPTLTCGSLKLGFPIGHTPGNRHDRRAKPGEGLWYCEQLAGTEVGVNRSGTGAQLGGLCCSQVQLVQVGAGYTFWSGRPKAERHDAGVAFAIRNDILGPRFCDTPTGGSGRGSHLRPLPSPVYSVLTLGSGGGGGEIAVAVAQGYYHLKLIHAQVTVPAPPGVEHTVDLVKTDG
ncbi:unnamed protein product [Schistocephalus solidus]|uniref:Tubulin domain-containing protein n=1 Tax=Schistocephalus solidus TaxID=70667 RepID=A0A183TJ52_SCHSO|nr:unnamed protein product [Schistocephalus solidus]